MVYYAVLKVASLRGGAGAGLQLGAAAAAHRAEDRQPRTKLYTHVYIYIYIYTHIWRDTHIYIYIYTYIIHNTYTYIQTSDTIHICVYASSTSSACSRGWRNTVGSLIETSWLKRNYYGPQFTGICAKSRGVRFHRIRDFKQY